MDWIERMNAAMDYVEDNLTEKMDYKKLAQAACCSEYHFMRMFAFITGIPLAEYVRRRRLTQAAFALQNSDIKVIDLALSYGYESPEAFARAFQALHGLSPSAARKKGAALKAYPRLAFQLTIKGESEMNYKIIQKPAFTVYGLEGIFDTADGSNLADIPKFWMESMENGEFVRLQRSAGAPATLNAVCDYRATGGTTFPYMICCLKTPLSDTTGYTTVDVPAGTWAVFTNDPHAREETSTALQALIKRVYTDWLPTASYDKLDGYEFEMYYDTGDGRCYEETWIRVRPKS